MEAKEIIKKDMEALYLGNLNTVEFNLNLPKKGKYGSEIIWKSGHERFLDSEGNVKRPPYGDGRPDDLTMGNILCRRCYRGERV